MATRGAAGAAKAVGKACGAKTRGGKLCKQPAGMGTNHYGTGKCKFHGGSTPNQIKAVAKEGYRQLFGTEMEINPLDALIWCIKITAGEVRWLTQRMAELQEEEFFESTINGKQFHLYARERASRQQDLARYSAQAISLGIAERAVKLAETYGEMIAKLIQGILGDLELTDEQRARSVPIIRKHLIMLDGGSPEATPMQIEAKGK